MTNDSANFAKLISEKINALTDKRARLASEIDVIDGKLQEIAGHLGVVPPVSGERQLNPRHREPPAAQPHPKFAGSLPEKMMDLLFKSERGLSRVDLKNALRESEVGDTVKKNENTYYNAVNRYLAKKKIVDIDGVLFHPERAPRSALSDMFPSNPPRSYGGGGEDGI